MNTTTATADAPTETVAAAVEGTASIVAGERVRVYTSPVTCLRLEGVATVLTVLSVLAVRDQFGRTLVEARVQFPSADAEPVVRVVSERADASTAEPPHRDRIVPFGVRRPWG